MIRVLLAGAIAAVAAIAPGAQALEYLKTQRGADGCVGAGSLTSWSAIAFAAAGDRVAARGAGSCLATHVAEIRNQTDRELFILGLVAGGMDPRAVGGHDLVAELERGRVGGYYRPGGTTNGAIFGILALRAVGRPIPRAVVARLLHDQASGGGFSFSPKGTEADMTAAAIEALVAIGHRCSYRPIARARKALAALRNRDGGFPIDPGGQSNVQSTAWAVQASAACGVRDVAATAYLLRQQAPDGSIRYGTLPRLWPTSQTIPALFRRPLPVR